MEFKSTLYEPNLPEFNEAHKYFQTLFLKSNQLYAACKKEIKTSLKATVNASILLAIAIYQPAARVLTP